MGPMQIKPQFLAFIFLSIFLSSCASTSTINIQEPDKLAATESKYSDQSTIYVFRGSSIAGVMWSFPIGLNDVTVGSVRREQYLAFPANVGAHWLTVTCPSLCMMPGFKINLNVSAGKSYYFMIEPSITMENSTTTLSSRLTQIDKGFADRLMETYKAAPIQ
jgi:hypothetical protein